MLGWVDGSGLNNLELYDKKGNNVIDEYFYARDNQLVCLHNLRLFKATKNVNIATNDCLFYVVKISAIIPRRQRSYFGSYSFALMIIAAAPS